MFEMSMLALSHPMATTELPPPIATEKPLTPRVGLVDGGGQRPRPNGQGAELRQDGDAEKVGVRDEGVGVFVKG